MKRLLLFILILFMVHGAIWAKEITPLQFFFTIKRLFPDVKNVEILISSDVIDKKRPYIERGAAQQQIKARLHLISSPADISSALKKVKKNNILIVFDSDILQDKKSKLFILKKCKEKKIKLVTSSKDYSDSGALIALLSNADNKVNIVVNLKHNEDMKEKFTEEFNLQNGITEIIQ